MANLDIYKKYIGKKVKVIKTVTEKYPDMVTINIDKDDALVNELQSLTIGAIRWLRPGYVHTQEFKLNRINVQIDKEGVIIDIHEG